MNLTPRAARQVQALEPGQAAAILDQLWSAPHQGTTSIIEVAVQGHGFRCFVGRHRNGCPVLLGLIAGCATNQASSEANPRDGPCSSQRHTDWISTTRKDRTMTVKPPTTHQIAELADERTTRYLGPKDAPAGYNAAAWAEQRRQVYAEQTDAARAELTRRFERDRDQETAGAARVKAAADDREAELRRRFDARFPGGSDADYQTLRPALLAELNAEGDRAEQVAHAEARRRVRI